MTEFFEWLGKQFKSGDPETLPFDDVVIIEFLQKTVIEYRNQLSKQKIRVPRELLAKYIKNSDGTNFIQNFEDAWFNHFRMHSVPDVIDLTVTNDQMANQMEVVIREFNDKQTEAGKGYDIPFDRRFLQMYNNHWVNQTYEDTETEIERQENKQKDRGYDIRQEFLKILTTIQAKRAAQSSSSSSSSSSSVSTFTGVNTLANAVQSAGQGARRGSEYQVRILRKIDKEKGQKWMNRLKIKKNETVKQIVEHEERENPDLFTDIPKLDRIQLVKSLLLWKLIGKLPRNSYSDSSSDSDSDDLPKEFYSDTPALERPQSRGLRELLDNYESDASEENEFEEKVRRKREIRLKAKEDIENMNMEGLYIQRYQQYFANLILRAKVDTDMSVRRFKKLVDTYVKLVTQLSVSTDSLAEYRVATDNIKIPGEFYDLTEDDDFLFVLDDYVYQTRHTYDEYSDQSSSSSSLSSGLSSVGTPVLVGARAAVSLILVQLNNLQLSTVVGAVLRKPDVYPSEMKIIEARYTKIIMTLKTSFPSLMVQTERVVGGRTLQRDEFLKTIFKICLLKLRNFDRVMEYISRLKIGDKTLLEILEEFVSEGTVYADAAGAGK